MPKKESGKKRKGRKSNGPVKLDWSVRKELWSDRLVPISEWLALFMEINPAGKWKRKGRTLIGLCPYHDERTPSFHVNFDLQICKCFGSCGKGSVDLVQLVARLMKTDYNSALVFLNDRFHLESLLGGSLDGFVERHALEEMKKCAAVAFCKVFDEFLRDRPDHLDYYAIAAAYVEKGRNIPLSLVPHLPFSVFPKPVHAKKYIPKEFHEAYDTYFADVDTDRYWGSLIFWYNDSIDMISMFKLRLMSNQIAQIRGSAEKFEDLSPALARGLFSKDFRVVDDPVERQMGVFGLHHYSNLIDDSHRKAIVTEGEFDALSVMVGQIQNGTTLDFPIFAAGGSSSGTGGFEFLEDFWIKTLNIVTDAPGDKRGVELAYNWLSNHRKVNTGSDYKGLLYNVFKWPAEMAAQAGDLDEAVQTFGYDYVRNRIWGDDSRNNFLNRLSWVTEQCDAEIAECERRIDEQKEKFSDEENTVKNFEVDKEVQKRQIISRWLKAIEDQGDQTVFTNNSATKHKIDLALLDDVYRSINNVDEVSGAVSVITKALFDLVSIPFYEMDSGNSQYYVYSKVRGSFKKLSLRQDAQILTSFSEYVGGDFAEWMKTLLRRSIVICLTEEERLAKYATNPTAVAEIEMKRCLTLFKKTFNEHAHNCVDKKTLIPIGQGIHYKDIHGNSDIYVLNGAKVFKGTLNPPSGGAIEWMRINDIRDGRYYFYSDFNDQWSETIEDVQDLYFGLQVNLNDVYKLILRVLDGWLFENHDVMRRYIAAWIMSLPIQGSTNRVNITYIKGESTSGKTSFIQHLLGGVRNSGHDIPYILEACVVQTDITEAFVYQKMDRSTLVFGLDEAETADTNNPHNRRNDAFRTLLYSVPTGGSDVGRGAADKANIVNYKFRSPVMMAAINIPVDETFLTRIVVLQTKKIYNRRSPADHINEFLEEGSDRLYELRKSISTGLIHRIPEIARRARQLDAILADVDTCTKVTTRAIAAVSTALAVYEACGTEEDPHDPIELYKGVIEANKSRLELIYTSDSKSQLLNSVLYTKCIPNYNSGSGVNEFVSPRDLILQETEEAATLLNNAQVGVYCLLDKGWVVFFWRQVKTSIINSRVPSYRDYTEGGLKETISKNRFVVPDITPDQHDYITGSLGIQDAKSTASYSVVSIEYLLDSYTKPESDGGGEAQSADVIPSEAFGDVVDIGF